MKDFFFGEVTPSQIGNSDMVANISLYDLINEKPANISPKNYTDQLNRLLNKVDNLLVVTDGTSSPSFSSLLYGLSSDDIHSVEIEVRTDRNENTPTLACNLVLLNGVVAVRPHWTGYKEIRSHEVLTTLLLPLYFSSLDNRTVLVKGNSKELLPVSEDMVIKELFKLATFQSQPDSEIYVGYLKLAKAIIADEFTGLEASNEFNRRRNLS